MPWDLKLSQNSDLLFAPNRDWVTTSGPQLLAQRIFMRLKIRRGSWVFDETHDLGSQLDLALQMQQPESITALPAFVFEALEPISDEIQVNDVQLAPSETDSRAVVLLINATPIVPQDVSGTPVIEVPSIEVTIPVAQLFSD